MNSSNHTWLVSTAFDSVDLRISSGQGEESTCVRVPRLEGASHAEDMAGKSGSDSELRETS